MNKYISELFQDWKQGLSTQVKEFQSVADDIRRNEQELVANHQIVKNTIFNVDSNSLLDL